MTNATATYTDDKYYVVFRADVKNDWIGDPSVPNGTMDIISIEDVEVESLTINDDEVEFDTLPEAEQATILAFADDLDFVLDEVDYDDSHSDDYNEDRDYD